MLYHADKRDYEQRVKFEFGQIKFMAAAAKED
jgi:hypothetical protein